MISALRRPAQPIQAVWDSVPPDTADRGMPRRRPRRPRRDVLYASLLIAWAFGMVVLAQWLHPSGPVEDPLITQQQLNF